MKRLLAVLALLLALRLHALGPADETNAVWLVTINHTGGQLHEFTLDYGTGRFHYQLFDRGLTFGDYAKVKGVQTMMMRYTDPEGAKHERAIDKPLQPAMIGGIVRLTLEKDGTVSYEYSEPSPPSAAKDPNVIDLRGSRSPWWLDWVLVAALGLLGLVAVYYGIKLAVRLGRGVKELLKDRFHETLKGPLQLQYVVCPIPMYSNNPRSPDKWWQGTYGGRMVGLRDSTTLWLGGVDEATRCVFTRDGRGDFVYQDYSSGRKIPGVDAGFRHDLSLLSPVVKGVNVLTVALEVTLDRKGDPAKLLEEDLPRLEALLDALGPPPPPVEEAYVAALKGPLRLERVRCPIPMYSNDESQPESWWQGEYEGRMLGIRDGGTLWLGKEDEETRGYFVREEGGGFRYHDHNDGKPIPGVGLHFKEELERLSPAAASVGVLSDALEVWLDPSGSPETLLTEDLPRLERMLEALEAAQEPS